jgi:TatD DNase family protein
LSGILWSGSNVRFVDAHIHLSDEEYSGRTEEIIAEAKNANVVALVSNSMDLKTSIANLELAERHAGMVYAALGVHPWIVKTLTENELKQVSELILKHKQDKTLIAIGEIGLDFKYEAIREKQVKVFSEMLRLAEKLALPVIIHSRGTTPEIVEMLPSYDLRRILLHWFSYPLSALTEIVDKGYYITEGPPTAYSEGIREIIRKVPLTNLLTETDGPTRFFKSPFDGKRITSAFIPVVAKAIAELKKMAVEDVAKQIAENFERFFEVKLE